MRRYLVHDLLGLGQRDAVPLLPVEPVVAGGQQEQGPVLGVLELDRDRMLQQAVIAGRLEGKPAVEGRMKTDG